MSVKETIIDEELIEKFNAYRKPKEGETLFQACSNNVIVFAQKMLGITLYTWQVIESLKFMRKLFTRKKYYELLKLGEVTDEELDSPEFCMITSRQIGKSTLIAILTIWCAVFNHAPCDRGFDTKALVTSASETQAMKLLLEMKKILYLGDANMSTEYLDPEGNSMFGEKFFTNLLATEGEGGRNNASEITFAKHKSSHGEYLLKGSKLGSTIKSYPATAKVLGESASLIFVDEAGKSDKISDTFYDEYLYPVGNSTHALRVNTSTPWLPSGFFYKQIDPDNLYKTSDTVIKGLYTIDAIRLEAPGYYNTVMKKISNLNSEGKNAEVQRAYYCRFVKNAKVYFDPDKVIDCFDTSLYEQISFKGMCDMGIDFGGQKTSKTVITISHYDPEEDVVKRIYHRSYDVGKDDTLLNDIRELMKSFNIQRIIPDDCPAGNFLIRRMEDLGWDVHPMNFRTWKVKKYGAFRSSLNKGKIKSYDDDNLKVEMLAMENSSGKVQSIIQAAPGYNDDLIDSFVMSTFFYVDDEDEECEFYEW